MIQRNWQPADLETAFFGVREEPVMWVDQRGNNHRIPGQRAIINNETNMALSVVSNQYNLILNQDAYQWADFVVGRVFTGVSLKDFVCYNVYMPKSKGSCRIDLIIPQSFRSPFGDDKENWTPFLRISNSYNKTLVLKYEIGFCRWICKNGVIFGQKGIRISIKHTDRINPFEIQREVGRQKEIQGIDTLWDSFNAKMQMLRDIRIPEDKALAMYCRAFGVKVSKNENITERQREILSEKTDQILKLTREYFNELGDNAYALFNVFTDYASYPTGYSSSSAMIHGFQKKAGLWADEIISDYQKPNFSLNEFIGKEAMESAEILSKIMYHLTER